MIDHAAATLAAEQAIAKVRADPIKSFRFSSYAQRRFVQAFHEYREVYLRAGNQSGKTHVAAHFFVALMRGVTSFCGDIVGVMGIVERAERVSLPLLGTPVRGLVLAQGREMSKESVLLAVMRAIGDWPHHVEKNGNVVAAVWVKPDREKSERWQDWSSLRFFVEDGQSVEGMRLDFVWADEPPKWKMWTSLRMRSRANRTFLRGITATPINKATWTDLRKDYKEVENRRGEQKSGKHGKIEIRLSVYDNKALSQDHLRKVEEDSAGLDQEAKLYGDYVDATGMNPFDRQGLERWRERTSDGVEVQSVTEDGRPFVYEVWGKPDPRDQYFLIADPSAGIEDEAHEHDPAGVVVISRLHPKTVGVVARYNGYMNPWDLGLFCAKLANEYNRAHLVWENNSGYGESFFRAVSRSGYGNIYIERHTNERGMPARSKYGWTTTNTSRGVLIGALQTAIKQDGLYLPSLAAVDSLSDVQLKKDGLRPEAKSGAHDEDMIVLGIGCHLLEVYPPAVFEKQGSQEFAEAFGLKLRSYVADDPFALS